METKELERTLHKLIDAVVGAAMAAIGDRPGTAERLERLRAELLAHIHLMIRSAHR